MRRLVIAVDCDDVLIDTTTFFVDAYNKKYGTSALVAQALDPAYEIWDADEEEQTRRWDSLTETDGYKDLEPAPETVDALRRLAMHHELHLVTARKEREHQYTEEVLGRELMGIFSSMEFVGWGGSKGEVCRRIKADVMVDDSMSHLLDAINCGLVKGNAILFGEYPWNQGVELPDGVVRCKNWQEVEAEIARIAAK